MFVQAGIGSAIGLALASELSKIVNSFSNHIIQPIIDIPFPESKWRQLHVRINNFDLRLGDFLRDLVEFTIAIFVFYLLFREIQRGMGHSKK